MNEKDKDLPRIDITTLRPRQRRVLELLRQGLSNDEIAIDIGLSIKSIKGHMTALFRQLGVKNRTQAALLARRVLGESLGDDLRLDESIQQIIHLAWKLLNEPLSDEQRAHLSAVHAHAATALRLVQQQPSQDDGDS